MRSCVTHIPPLSHSHTTPTHTFGSGCALHSTRPTFTLRHSHNCTPPSAHRGQPACLLCVWLCVSLCGIECLASKCHCSFGKLARSHSPTPSCVLLAVTCRCLFPKTGSVWDAGWPASGAHVLVVRTCHRHCTSVSPRTQYNIELYSLPLSFLTFLSRTDVLTAGPPTHAPLSLVQSHPITSCCCSHRRRPGQHAIEV